MAAKIPLSRSRGDNFPFAFVATDEESGAVIDITGYSFTLSVSEEEFPDVPSYVFQLTDFITNAAAGEFEFRPSLVDVDLRPGVYYYDVESVDTNAYVRTMAKHTLTIDQDIGK